MQKTLISKIKKSLRNFHFIIELIRKAAPAYFILLIIFSFLQGILPIFPMLIMKSLLDLVVYNTASQNIISKIIILISGLLCIQVLIQLLQWAKQMISELTSNIVSKKMFYEVQHKAATIDLKFFDSPFYYSKLENTKRIFGRKWDYLLSAPAEILAKLVSLATMIAIIGSYTPWLILVLMAGITPNILMQLKIRKREIDFYSGQIPETRKIFYTESLLSHIAFAKEVRIFGLADYILDLSRKLFSEHFNKIKKLKIWQLKINSFWSLLAQVTSIGALFMITCSALIKSITIGNWHLYTEAARSIHIYLSAIIALLTFSYEDHLYTEIFNDFMQLEPEIKPGQGRVYSINGAPPLIEFKDVSFLYPGHKTLILDRANFTIKPGENIALVGLNGAGKTTLIKLITRLYEPSSGTILFDGVDIREYDVRSFYKLFNIVFQDYARYAFTLKENIGISNLDKWESDAAVREAALLSGADTVAGKMAQGYNTYITKEFDMNGCSDISIGEWQKIALARGFFRQAPVIILDEPTSSLDAEAEYHTFNHYLKMAAGKTAVLISHRLSSVRMADRIFYLQDGKVSEQGTHHELMRNSGKYAQLFTLQAEQYCIPAGEC